jgi:hypothetical protein
MMKLARSREKRKPRTLFDPGASDCYLSTNTENMPSQVDELEPLFRPMYSGAITENAASV